MKKISGCLIVKNEAENIVRCAEELAKFCDEIIVVDTGSNDGTKKLASEWGCKVYDFEWVDDFSAARNFSIEKASNDWVYWHDGDDSVNDDNIKEIKNLKFHNYDAFFFDVRSLGGENKIRWVNSRIRLFKKSAGFKFKKPIHEDIEHIDGLRYGNPGVYINHLGYVENEDIKAKSSRNMKVLEKRKDDFPEASYYIANEYMLNSEIEKAEREFNAFLHSTEDNSFSGLRFSALLKLAVMSMRKGDKEQAQISLFEATALDGERPEPYLLLGDLEPDKKKSVAIYEKALDKAQMPGFMPVTVDVAFYTYLPYMRLGDAYYASGEYEKAVSSYRAALVFNEEFTECLIKLKDCHRLLADYYGGKALKLLV